MAQRSRERIREHLHGLAAGSLTVLALFVAFAVPLAVVEMARGTLTWATAAYPLIFLAFAGGALVETRRWHASASHRAARS